MRAEETTWVFVPTQAVAGGALDLRGLNERVAGEHGFIRHSADSNGLVRGDGQPLRLWGVAAHTGGNVTDDDMARHARFLARMGVNSVRVGGAVSGIIPQHEGAAFTDINHGFLTTVWRTVALMKREGIYTRIAPLWDHGSITYINPAWGLEGYTSGDTLNALLFFEPKLQAAYKSWMRTLLTATNCFTGVPLACEPAVAIIQIVSEDSMFFWWIDKVKGGPLRTLQSRFAEFLMARYGSLAAATNAWHGSALGGDEMAEGRMGLYPLAELVRWPVPAPARRLRDQTAFMALCERAFYREMMRYLKDELGARQLVAPSNFGPCDETRLGDLQRWSWSAADVLEYNKFMASPYRGAQAGWRIQAGDVMEARSALRTLDIPALRTTVARRPFVLSSTTWLLPNPYTVEGPLLNAACGALHALDGIYWFAATAPVYDVQPYFTFTSVQGSHPLKRWTISHPGLLSQFPAAALIFRQGLVDAAEVAVHETRTFEDMCTRQAPRRTETYAALMTGRMTTAYHEDETACDTGAQAVVASSSHAATAPQVQLARAAGVMRINAPCAQGVVGFLDAAGGEFTLDDVVIRSSNEYAAIIAVALDDRPLAQSRRVLVQMGTVCEPTGWRTAPASTNSASPALTIESTGTMPWRLRTLAAELTIRNPALCRASILDELGHTRACLPVRVSRRGAQVTLPRDAVYVILHAHQPGRDSTNERYE